jgi:hypothetical protein
VDLTRLEALQACGLLEHTLALALDQQRHLAANLAHAADLRHTLGLARAFHETHVDAGALEVELDSARVEQRLADVAELARIVNEAATSALTLRATRSSELQEASRTLASALVRPPLLSRCLSLLMISFVGSAGGRVLQLPCNESAASARALGLGGAHDAALPLGA